MGLVEHCLCAECHYALHATGLSSFFNRANAMLTHPSSLSFLTGTLLAKHTQSPLPVRLSLYQLLDSIFILHASSMREHTHRVGPGYCNGVRPLVHIYCYIGLLSHRPNPVGPYYLQVYTSSVNGALPDDCCLTPWQFQDISSSDHHPCRRCSDLCKSSSTNDICTRYEIILQDWAVPFPPGTLVGSLPFPAVEYLSDVLDAQYQICMVCLFPNFSRPQYLKPTPQFDKNGNTGGCQATYTVIANTTGTPSCGNVTFPHTLSIDAQVNNGPISQYGWVNQVSSHSLNS